MSDISNKLGAIQSELKAPKGQYNSFGKYKYRSCEDIVESVKPLLKKHGCALTLTDEVVELTNRVYIKATATLKDCGEGTLEISTTAYAREPDDKKGMDESQITGTASSYARKYALNGLFCIDDTKDADTDEYTQTATTAAAKKAPAKKAPVQTKSNVPVCAVCGKAIEAGGNMTAEQVAEASKTKYGKAYCSACRAEKRQAEEAKKQILELN